MSRVKRPGWYAPLALDYFTHPKTKLVSIAHPLAAYGFLFLTAEEGRRRLLGDESGEVHMTWSTFSVGSQIGASSDVHNPEQGPIRRCLAAYQHVGWIELLEADDIGFRALMRNAAAWHGQDDLAKSAPREEKKREEETEEPIRLVFEHWKQALDQPKSRLGTAVTGHIRARLGEGRTVDELKQAIDGCAASQWHRDNGQIGLSLICRNDEKLIQFMARAPKRKGDDFNEGMGIT